MQTPVSSGARAGVTTLMVFAPFAMICGLAVSFLTLLSTLNVDVGPDQVAGYSGALALGALPALGLIVIAIAGRRLSVVRRTTAALFGVLCAAVSFSYTAPMLVDAVQHTVESERLRTLPVTAAEQKYSVADLRELSTRFLADSTAVLDRPHPVVPTDDLAQPCKLGNLQDGTKLVPLSGKRFWTFDSKEAALAAIAGQWQTSGYEVVAEGDALLVESGGGDWLESAEAHWVPDAVDYNLVINYESICVAE